MQINDLSKIFTQIDAKDIWEDIVESTREIYVEKGGEYVVRIIGPVIKASRCYLV